VFVVDCTASMGSYIKAAQNNIRKIMERIVAFEKTDARFGLVAYRDHPPQDSTYVTRTFDFTSSRKTMQSSIDWMSAQGGGDGPEAVAAGLKAAVDMDWRKGATKVMILIADAPPHGLGESGDGFPNGCPDGNDPLELARTMLQRGITCYPVGCEPALGQYNFARDFMCTLARITEGQAVTLSSAELLADVIIGGAQEEVALEKIMDEVSQEVEEEQAAATARGEALDEEELCTRVQSKLKSRGTRTRQMKHDSKMAAPQADTMSGMESLAAWRKAAPAPAPSAYAYDEELLDCLEECAEMPRSRSARKTKPKRSKKMSKSSKGFSLSLSAARRASADSDDEEELDFATMAGAAAPSSKSASVGATTVTVEDDYISRDQVMRCMKKSAARTKH